MSPRGLAAGRVFRPLGRALPALLRFAAVIGTAAALYLFAWRPLSAMVDEARRGEAERASDVARMSALVRDWQALTAAPPSPTAALTEASVRRRARALGIDSDGWRIAPVPGGLSLEGEVGFDAWVELIAELSARREARLGELDLSRAGPGRVRVEAVLLSG